MLCKEFEGVFRSFNHSMKKYFLPVSVFFLLLSFSLLTTCSKGTPGRSVEGNSAQKPIPVRVVETSLKQIHRSVESVGSLFPYEEVTVSSEVEGKVDQVLVDVGDTVSAGQPIVKVSPIELQLALEQQRAALRQAAARLGLPEEGGDLKDVREAAEVKRAAADLSDAEQKYKRAKSLMEQGLVPQQSMDEVEARYKTARANYDLAVQTVQNLRAQVAQFRAATTLAQKKLADAVIRAPFAGQVKERNVTQGQYLKVQTPVMVIVNVDPLRVRLKVPEKMAGWIHNGQEVTLSVDAYLDKKFVGKVSRINPSVDQQTRSFEVEALIENHERSLKPGFFVKASIPSSRIENTLMVPQDSLQYVYGIYKIYTVEGNSLKEKEVKIGERSGTEVEIVDGLAAGERIAVPGKGQVLKDRIPIEPVT